MFLEGFREQFLCYNRLNIYIISGLSTMETVRRNGSALAQRALEYTIVYIYTLYANLYILYL